MSFFITFASCIKTRLMVGVQLHLNPLIFRIKNKGFLENAQGVLFFFFFTSLYGVQITCGYQIFNFYFKRNQDLRLGLQIIALYILCNQPTFLETQVVLDLRFCKTKHLYIKNKYSGLKRSPSGSYFTIWRIPTALYSDVLHKVLQHVYF